MRKHRLLFGLLAVIGLLSCRQGGGNTSAPEMSTQTLSTNTNSPRPPSREIESPIHGVTLTDVDDLDDIVTSLDRFDFRPTARIVFDEWQPATNYEDAAERVHGVSYVMGELLDSKYVGQYSLEQYRERAKEYVHLLDKFVDIWEIGNEVNGHWVRKKEDTARPDPPEVVEEESKLVGEKMLAAYEAVKEGDESRKTAITLYYNDDGRGHNCWVNPGDEMLSWAGKYVPQKIRDNVDFVLVSYYEDHCEGFLPDWPKLFDELGRIFTNPKTRLGFGECGTENKGKKKEQIEKYYKLKVDNPRYVGGYFWWYFKKDMVPYKKKVNGVQLWGVLNRAVTGQ